MQDDPIVDEIHRIREKLLAEAGGDIEKLMDRLKAGEAEDRARVVSHIDDLRGMPDRRTGLRL